MSVANLTVEAGRGQISLTDLRSLLLQGALFLQLANFLSYHTVCVSIQEVYLMFVGTLCHSSASSVKGAIALFVTLWCGKGCLHGELDG